MDKIIDTILKLFRKWGCTGSKKKWDECRKSSNWHGANASWRMMNMLSPKMPDSVFNERLSFIKSRGCDTVNLFVCNKADGEYGGYSIYGSSFSWNIDKNYCKTMLNRIKKLYEKGYGIVLWLASDDSDSWNRTMIQNPKKYIEDLDKQGFLEYASTVVIGLEADEYWNSAQCLSMYTAIKERYSGKVGIHQTSGKYSFAGTADLMFYQVNPGTSTSKITSDIQKIKASTGKPVCMFEMERQEDRARSEAALKAGAFSVGNW